jgi:hypothetical protein
MFRELIRWSRDERQSRLEIYSPVSFGARGLSCAKAESGQHGDETIAVGQFRACSEIRRVMPAGQSTIEGVQALQFMRTRHSFFDGSDIGRTETVHYFLSQLIGVARTKFNLGNARTLLGLAQAASQSTTVSANLDSVSGLEGLAEAMSRIPSSKISFVTEPWHYNPTDPNDSNVYLTQPAAQQMFANVQNDVPYSDVTVTAPTSPTSTPAASTAAAATASVNRATIQVGVYNGNGVEGRASAIVSVLAGDGFAEAEVGGDASGTVGTSEVYYATAGQQADADAVAAALGIPTAQVQSTSQYPGVTVVLGTDFESGTAYSAASGESSAPAAPTSAASAPSESFLTNAGESGGECIPVRQYYTDEGINGNMSNGTLDMDSTSQIVPGLNGGSPDTGTP